MAGEAKNIHGVALTCLTCRATWDYLHRKFSSLAGSKSHFSYAIVEPDAPIVRAFWRNRQAVSENETLLALKVVVANRYHFFISGSRRSGRHLKIADVLLFTIAILVRENRFPRNWVNPDAQARMKIKNARCHLRRSQVDGRLPIDVDIHGAASRNSRKLRERRRVRPSNLDPTGRTSDTHAEGVGDLKRHGDVRRDGVADVSYSRVDTVSQANCRIIPVPGGTICPVPSSHIP